MASTPHRTGPAGLPFVEMGTVGVVVSYVGPPGTDLTGADYKHGQLVEQGQRGVWQVPLQPGKYAYNPYAYKVKTVPTTNFQLRWIEAATDGHNFDANLSEIRLITRDAFEPILPLSIVVHIAQEDAPYVLQQFGPEIGNLVDQSLDPMVSAWFKDAAQALTLIELVNERAALQAKALAEMKVRFGKYRLNVMEVMIGTPARRAWRQAHRHGVRAASLPPGRQGAGRDLCQPAGGRGQGTRTE